MKELIKNIIEGNCISEIFDYVLNNLYHKGPIDGTDMEILSYLALYQPKKFEDYNKKFHSFQKHKSTQMTYLR